MTPISPEAVAQMVADLTTKAAMINMGEKIAWGSDSGVMDAAADMITTLSAENATLRASEAAALERVKTVTDMATDYLRIATEIGSCGDGGCVVLQQKGQHTNGGCRCLYCLDRSELRRLNSLLGIAQAMAKFLTPTADKEPKT